MIVFANHRTLLEYILFVILKKRERAKKQRRRDNLRQRAIRWRRTHPSVQMHSNPSNSKTLQTQNNIEKGWCPYLILWCSCELTEKERQKTPRNQTKKKKKSDKLKKMKGHVRTPECCAANDPTACKVFRILSSLAFVKPHFRSDCCMYM